MKGLCVTDAPSLPISTVRSWGSDGKEDRKTILQGHGDKAALCKASDTKVQYMDRIMV